MPCQICGKYSSFYPLCQKHFRMKDKSEVNKCKDCGIWFLGKEDTCFQCLKGVKKAKDLIHINKEAFVKWAKTLYSIGKTGEKWNENNDPELRRYDKVLRVSSSMYDVYTITEESLVSIEKDLIEKWGKDLYDLAKDGLKKTQNNHDVERYNDVLEIQQQLVSTIEAASKDYSEKPHKKVSQETEDIFKVDFIADREIMFKMIELIDLAKREILIASPWIWESEEVLDAMKKAVDEKQIRVRIVTRTADYEKDQKHKATVLALHKLGFQIEHDEKVHAKLLLIDETELLIGSANLVGTSLNRNHEVALCTNHPKTVRDAKIYFTDLMADIFIKKIDRVVTE